MYITATKAQLIDVGALLGSSSTMYVTSILNNVTQVAISNGAGWVAFVVSGVYSEADFISDFAGAVKVTAIVLS